MKISNILVLVMSTFIFSTTSLAQESTEERFSISLLLEIPGSRVVSANDKYVWISATVHGNTRTLFVCHYNVSRPDISSRCAVVK